MRSEFSTEHFSFVHEDAESLWYIFRPIIDSFHGDTEKFYSAFYALFLDNILPRKFEDKILTNTLLAEVANEVLIHLSGCKDLEPEVNVPAVSEKN